MSGFCALYSEREGHEKLDHLMNAAVVVLFVDRSWRMLPDSPRASGETHPMVAQDLAYLA